MNLSKALCLCMAQQLSGYGVQDKSLNVLCIPISKALLTGDVAAKDLRLCPITEDQELIPEAEHV